MSDYGLLIKNSDGQVQIDSTYENYSYFSSVVASVTTNTNEVNITDTTKVPIIAWKPSTTYCTAHVGFTKSGSTFTHAKFLGEIGGISSSITVHTYVEGQVNASTNYGLLVYNSSGTVVFSSDDTPMKIVGVYPDTLTFDNVIDDSNNVEVTVDDATNNYFMLVPVYPQYIGFSCNPAFPASWVGYFFTKGLKKIDSTTIRVAQFLFHSQAGGGGCPGSVDYWVDDHILLEISA